MKNFGTRGIFLRGLHSGKVCRHNQGFEERQVRKKQIEKVRQLGTERSEDQPGVRRLQRCCQQLQSVQRNSGCAHVFADQKTRLEGN